MRGEELGGVVPGIDAGDELSGYRLESRIGRGGFGDVWLARHTASGEPAAVKVLSGDLAERDVALVRADVELLAASASAESPYVVRVLGGGAEPVPHIVMEYVDGEDLAARLRRDGPLPAREALAVGVAVVEALRALHAAAIIHRDVKPGNVMLDRAGGARLTDFGVAKIVGFQTITATGRVPMSIAYAAPEVWEGRAEYASDVYALGALLYECLCGEPPFRGTHTEVFRQHLAELPSLERLPRETPRAARELIEGCLAKEPAARPDLDACAARLREAESELTSGTGAAAVGQPRRFGPWVVREAVAGEPFRFRCHDPASGQEAVVEVRFGDEVGLGERLQAAVEANARLVPLGAERLLGASRVVLRPDEAWAVEPPGRFAFWLASEAAPPPAAPASPLDEAALRLAASGLVALRDAVQAAGLPFEPGPADVAFDAELRPRLARAGVPGEGAPGGDGAALAALARLPLWDAARDRLEGARRLDDLLAVGPSTEEVAPPASELAASESPPSSPAVTRGVGTRLGRPGPRVLAVAGGAVALVVALAAAVLVFGEAGQPESSDAADIAGLGGGPARSGVQPGPGPTSEPGVQWLLQTAGPVRGAVTADDDHVYVVVGEALVALDNESGAERWRFAAGGGLTEPAATAAGLVYVGGEDGVLYALDAGSGDARWSFDAGSAVRSSPVVAGGAVYFGADSGHVFALDGDDGDERWRLRTGDAVRAPVALAVDEGLVVAGSDDGAVYALDAGSGEVRWRSETGGVVRAAPAVADGAVYVKSADGLLYALDLASGDERWDFDTGASTESGAAVSGGAVFVAGAGGRVRALSVEDGSTLWTYETRGAVLGSPAVVRSAGTGFAADLDAFQSTEPNPSRATGRFTAELDGEAGRLAYTLVVDDIRNATIAHIHMGERGVAGPAVADLESWDDPVDAIELSGTVTVDDLEGPLVGDWDAFVEAIEAGGLYLNVHTVAYPSEEIRGQVEAATNSVVYVGSDDGQLHAIDGATGRGLWTFQSGGPVRSSPVVVDGLAYIGSDDAHLYALGANE